MKIAFILPSLINTGPTIVIINLIKKIINSVEHIDVYYFDDKDSLIFPCQTIQIRFNDRIDFEKYDIVHSNMYRPDKYIAHWKSTIDTSKTALISTIHQDIFNNLRYSYNIGIAYVFDKIWRRHLKSFDCVVLISNKLDLLYKSDFTRRVVIYNGVDVHYQPQLVDFDIERSILKLKQKGLITLGSYAAINKRKGLDQIFELLKIRTDIGYVLIGEGKEKDRLERLSIRNGFKDRVLFLPYLKFPYNYLEHIDIYLMPSRSEGFGLAMVEAAITKTPIICSDIDVFREIFTENEAAFFQLEDIKSLSNAIDRIQSAYSLFQKYGYEKASCQFTAHVMAHNYLNLYQTLIRKH